MFIIQCTGDLEITINDESGGKITEQVLSHARDRPRDLKSRFPPLRSQPCPSSALSSF